MATTRHLFILMTVLSTQYPLLQRSARADEGPAAPVTYEKDVKAVFRQHCVTCHNPDRPRGDLDLSTFAGVMAGGSSGKAVLAGRPDDSLLYALASHREDPKMPPNKPKIAQRELDLIRHWVAGGLVEKAGGKESAAGPSPAKPGGLVQAAPLARPSPITALAVSPTAPLAAVAGRKQVLLYELTGGKLLGGVPFPEGEIHVLRFGRDGKELIAAGGVGGQSGKVVGFEVGSWKRLFDVGDDFDAVLAADISADKARVVCGGPGRSVKVFSVADGTQLHAFRKPTDWVLSVGFSPEGLLVAAGDRFGGLYVWEAKSGKEFGTLRGHTRAVTGIAWRADSNVLASCSEDGTVRLWDMHTATERAKWDAHEEGVLAIDFHPAGWIATAGRDGRVKVWDATGQRIANLGPAADAVFKIGFTADAKALITGDWSGNVRIFPVDGLPALKLDLPLDTTRATAATIPVPVPANVIARPTRAASTPLSAADELARKRAALKAVEDAAERLKEEAARNPKNPALAKAYLQVCEAVLVLKTEVLETEAAARSAAAGQPR